MKKRTVLFGLLLVALFASNALAGVQDFTLVNSTGVDIHYVYVSEDFQQNWGNDVLAPNQILRNGENVPINFTGQSNHCIWDLKVVDANGNAYDWRGLDLCSLYRVILYREYGNVNYCTE